MGLNVMGMNRDDMVANIKATTNGSMPFIPFLCFQLALEIELGRHARTPPN
jgi:hypothetical protein